MRISIISICLIAISCNQSQTKVEITDTTRIDTTPVKLDTVAATVDTNTAYIDTSAGATKSKEKPTKFRKPTIDEIADSRYPHSLKQQMGYIKRPLTQEEIEEDEFYEEYKFQRDLKRKAKARERALKELNKKY